MKRILFVFLFLTFSLVSFAQKKYTSNDKKAIKFYQKALELSRLRQTDEALVYLEKAVERDNHFMEALLFSADLYSDQGKSQKMIAVYEQATAINPSFFPNALFNLANAYLKQGKYEKALNAYRAFLNLGKISDQNRKISLYKVKCCEFALEAMQHPSDFNAQCLSDLINTEADEYWPSLTADEQTLIFTRLLPTGQLDRKNREVFQEDFCCSEKQGETWTESKALSEAINTERNEGAQTITADGRYMYFTACGRKDGRGRCDIYYSKKEGDTWSEPINCGANINTKAWEAQPSISADGRCLYFVSNRKSGKGKMDIWKSELLEILDDGRQRWTQAENLNINTSGNEMSPFIHASNTYLVFASDALVGMGAYDLFQVNRLANGEWSEPKNLSYPINTYNDEIGLFITAKGDKGYFSSNRIAAKGRDIYEFDMPLDLQPTKVSYLKGKVYDVENKKPLSARLILLDIENRDTIAYLNSDRVKGEYLVCLPEGKDYLFHAEADGYLFYSDHFKMREGEFDQAQKKDIPLQAIQIGKEVILKNIFFETDSWEIKPESESELNSLYDLLVLNKNLSIEIAGHTDNTGSESNNKILSENRAKAVYSALIERGIQADRLSFKGYASSKPIGDNKTEEGKAMNRRTEFKVIKK
ncbi:tetratricopeptide repeat protein [Ancylomarina salipaludis]|uniref:Tetratricopeptide repeat protein n=1 Tax=Ancylomarina salipaludis TaxID=2501299 RepID=A0A4Q1JKW0_9BACT|nr:OmpA family protein [Ancylomarina salipaludis]RXQ93956.1 tetratricopeptide repeat protein [Ancylomarina salipaludis]